MALRRLITIAGHSLLLFLACSNPSDADLQRLKVLNEIYGQKYSFELSIDAYLEVESRGREHVSEEELIRIYKLFFFDESGMTERETTFIYLNWYDWRGKFQYQIFYDPREGEFKKSKQDHY